MGTIGVGLGAPLRELPDLARLAEGLGYDSIWQVEGRGGDQYSILTACALATSTIGLGTNISSVFVRSAPLIAMAAATVDSFSRGRLTLGLGIDHPGQVIDMHGLPYERPRTRMRETVQIIRELWRRGEVSHQGKVFDIKRFDMWLEVERPRIPVLLGGVMPQGIEFAGEVGDGVITVNHGLSSIPEVCEHVTRGAEKAGRSRADVQVAAMVSVAVGEDEERLRASVRRALVSGRTRNELYVRLKRAQGYGEEWDAVYAAQNAGDLDRAAGALSDRYLDDFTITGTPERCRERIQRFFDAGVDTLILSLNGSDGGLVGGLRALAPGR